MAWELTGNAGTDPARDFLGTTDDQPLVIQPGSGNVGIGTRTPDSRLNVNSDSQNAPAALLVSNGNADTRLGIWSGFISGGNTPAIFYTHDLRFAVGSLQDFSEAMRITQGGNIGIGTQNPSSKVEIAAQDGLAVTGFQPFITLRDANSGTQSIIQCADGHIGLIPSNRGNATAMLLQANTLNVGIGTLQPNTRLHVVGGQTGIGLLVEANLNSALIATCTAPNSTAFFVNQRGNGHIMVGRDARQAEVFRVTNSGDAQVRGVTLQCDVNVKENLSSVNTVEILETLSGLPIQGWNYKTDPTYVRHIGPTSQDFQTAFGLNGDDQTNISSVDAQGIALAAIQGLNEKLNAENAELRTSLTKLERRLAALESAFEDLV